MIRLTLNIPTKKKGNKELVYAVVRQDDSSR